MKISIIGAGPAGSFAAYKLAKNFDVEIFEEHSEIGKPVQCSGLVTQTIKKVDKIFRGKNFEKTIINKIRKVRLFSHKEKCEIELKKPDIILNREKFDKWLASLAKRRGAKIHLNSRFLKFKREKEGLLIFVEQKNKVKKIKTDILIGADGAFSQVSKRLGDCRNFIPCIQANIPYKSNLNAMDIFFSSDYKELFAWIVQKNSKIAEAGLGCREKPGEKFEKFLKEKKTEGKILSYTGGVISLYNPSYKISDKNIFLVGEAAGFVKASTLGGIISSLESVKVLTNSLLNGKNYEKGLKNLKKEMKLHYLARKVLNKFSNTDYDSLLRLCNTKKVKDLLKEYSRDEYWSNSFVLRLLIAQPLLGKFLFKIFM